MSFRIVLRYILNNSCVHHVRAHTDRQPRRTRSGSPLDGMPCTANQRSFASVKPAQRWHSILRWDLVILEGPVIHSAVCVAGADARGMFRAVQARGQGYALATKEELQFTLDVAESTGNPCMPNFQGLRASEQHP